MARIPEVIERQIPQSPRSVVAIRPDNYAGVQGLASGLDTAGELAARATENKRRARADFETSYAANELLKSHLSTLDAFSESDEYDNFVPTYQKNMGKAKTDAGALISDEMARQRFFLQADEMIMRGSVTAHESSMKKEGDVQRGKLQGLLDDSRLHISSDSATNEANIRNAQRAIVSARDAGYIDHDAAAKLQSDWAENYAIGSFELLPAQAQIDALNGKSTNGMLAYIPGDKRAIMLERAETQLTQQQSRARTAEADALQDGQLSALNMIEAGGQIEQIPRDVWENSPLPWRESVKSLARGDLVKTDPATYQALLLMQTEQPEVFMDPRRTNLTILADKLSPGTLQALQEDQRAMRAGDAKSNAELTDKLRTNTQIFQSTAPYVKAGLGIDPNTKDEEDAYAVVRYREAVMDEVLSVQAKERRVLSRSEVDEISKRYMQTMTLRENEWLSRDVKVPLFDVLNTIPRAEVDSIREAFKLSQNREPTGEEIAEAYRKLNE